MGRLVKLAPAKGAVLAAAEGPGDIKDYLERVGKYIPGEVVALYLLLTKWAGTGANKDKEVLVLSLLAFAACLILTPVYLKLASQPGDALLKQSLISAGAFMVWAYALGGWIAELGYYHEKSAGFALILYSAIVGTIRPRAMPAPAPPPNPPGNP